MEERVTLEQLNVLLASLTVLKQNSHALHWLATGKSFYDIHKESEVVYKLAEEYIDITAELIVQRNEKPITSLSELLSISVIHEIDTSIEISPDVSEDMWDGVLTDVVMVKTHLNDILSVKEDIDTYSTLQELLPKMNKIIWMMSVFSK